MAATTARELSEKAALEPTRPSAVGVTLRRVLGTDWQMGFLFVLPIILLVLSLIAYPFSYAIYLSMTRKFVGMPPVWVGFENYIRLAHDGFFLRAVWNSFIFTFGSVVFKLVLGMLMALVLTSNIRFRNVFSGVLLVTCDEPIVVPVSNICEMHAVS